ncbi:MAG: hypothetical protein K8H88_08255 [Sandaracinaceae bacterium]|nr:hypothetical protein [Sandaracinaceae bacterium]
MTEEKNETREREVEEVAEKAAGALLGIGRLWAAHGLSVGRSALETSAHTLRSTAELLGALSERFAKKAAQAERDAAGREPPSEERGEDEAA